MAHYSKRVRSNNTLVDSNRSYKFDEAWDILKSCKAAKFDETIEAAIRLGINTKHSDQNVRGAVNLPYGTGKKVRVAVFAIGAQAEEALKAGADKVGAEDLADAMKAGELNWDVVIATPETMRIVGQLGQILGPRGLMPNPKVGTVTVDVSNTVKNVKTGQVRYRTDKAGIVHCAIGKLSFSLDQVQGNLLALLEELKKAKPTTSKGIYLKALAISSTMGPGIAVDLDSLKSK